MATNLAGNKLPTVVVVPRKKPFKLNKHLAHLLQNDQILPSYIDFMTPEEVESTRVFNVDLNRIELDLYPDWNPYWSGFSTPNTVTNGTYFPLKFLFKIFTHRVLIR